MKRKAAVNQHPIEFLPSRFFFLLLREPAHSGSTVNASHVFVRPTTNYMCLDDQILSSACTKPISLEITLRFNHAMNKQLTEDGDLSKRFFYVNWRGNEFRRRQVAAIRLICAWRLLQLHLSPEEAMMPFSHAGGWIDPSGGSIHPQFGAEVPLLSTLKAIRKAIDSQILDSKLSWESKTNFEWGCENHRFIRLAPELLVLSINDSNKDATDTNFNCGCWRDLREQHNVVMACTASPTSTKSHCEIAGIQRVNIFNSISQAPDSGFPVPLEAQSIFRFLDVLEFAPGSVVVIAQENESQNPLVSYLAGYLISTFQFAPVEAIAYVRLHLSSPGISAGHAVALEQMKMELQWYSTKTSLDEYNQVNQGVLTKRLGSPVNVGTVSLERQSLLGVKSDMMKRDTDGLHGPTSLRTMSPRASSAHARRVMSLHNSHRMLQEANGSRRTTFSTIHKYLHQPPATAASRGEYESALKLEGVEKNHDTYLKSSASS